MAYHTERPSNLFKIYNAGVYTIALKSKETTDHWIMFNEGTLEYFVKSPDGQFERIFDDGEIVSGNNEASPRNRVKYWIRAKNDQVITMTVGDIKRKKLSR